MSKRLLGMAVAILILSQPDPAFADCTNPTGVEAQITYNADQNVPQICTGTAWVALGALNPTAGGSGCTNPAETEGAIIYNKDIHAPQYCDGDDWRELIGHIGGSFLAFTDITGQSTSTLTTSNILQVSISGSQSISISGDGSPAYRICADDQCNSETQTWGSTAGTISNGQFLQLELTSNASLNVTNSATVTVGAGSSQWNVLTSDPCTGSHSPGDVLSDGTVYIGQVGGNDICASTSASETTLPWNNGNGSGTYVTTGLTSTTDGPGNTLALTEHPGGGACQQGDICDSATSAGVQPHLAAQYCADLSAHGYTDWYLPAKDELNLFWNSGTPLAGVDTSGTYYWSSTEFSLIYAWGQRFSDGSQNKYSAKQTAILVRCVRR